MKDRSNRTKSSKNSSEVGQYGHDYKSRPNNPQVGMVTADNDADAPKKKYSYDPHLDPALDWSGKKEGQAIDIDTISVHVHERIDPKTIISNLHWREAKSYQANFFDDLSNRPLREEMNFYQHKNAWVNRLIAGDSLLVLNSLLEKEGMAGSTQMVYIDPPYGISYGSNFQPYTNQTTVTDRKDSDLSVEPEMIRAFRDTWQLGIHSYLSYMRDRLLIAREMLTESGSCFVQISDENVHHIRELMDEIFGVDNFVSQINIKRASVMFAKKYLNTACYYVVWYAKDIDKLKYRPLFTERTPQQFADTAGSHLWVESADGKASRRVTPAERKNIDLLLKQDPNQKLFGTLSLNAQGIDKRDPIHLDGNPYTPPRGTQWKTSYEGLEALKEAGRMVAEANTIRYKQYLADYPIFPVNNLWQGIGSASDKVYVVQTSSEIVKRCVLMSTDPGDLVLDPTCGSGTTAFVAEQWGRRWITIDTSRIAIQLARQRLLTSAFDWYEFAHENEGVAGGFVYQKASHVTLGSIAQNEPTQEEVLYDKPKVDKGITRVTGPFTVEAVPAAISAKPLKEVIAHGVADQSINRGGETARQDNLRNELLKTGIRARGGEKINLVHVEILEAASHLHAVAETEDGRRAFVSFGPDHAPLEQTQVEKALREAEHRKPSPDLIVFAAFQFDPEASKDIDEISWPNVTLLKAQMNADLLTTDLKSGQSSSDSFWLLGQPDVRVDKQPDGQFVVSVEGFDYYDPASGKVRPGSKKEIASWMLDTDYDQRSIFPAQVFLPMASTKNGWQKLAKTLKAELNEDALSQFYGTSSLPFQPGSNECCAVKIIDNRGIEYFCVKSLN